MPALSMIRARVYYETHGHVAIHVARGDCGAGYVYWKPRRGVTANERQTERDEQVAHSRCIRGTYRAIANKKIDYEGFKRLKLDHTYPERMTYRGEFWMDEMFVLDGKKYPEIADALKRIADFDKTADTLDRNFPMMLMTIYELLDYNG